MAHQDASQCQGHVPLLARLQVLWIDDKSVPPTADHDPRRALAQGLARLAGIESGGHVYTQPRTLGDPGLGKPLMGEIRPEDLFDMPQLRVPPRRLRFVVTFQIELQRGHDPDDLLLPTFIGRPMPGAHAFR